MKAIYFSGKTGSGKTSVALGLGLKFQEKGARISYFKPLGFTKGATKVADEDVLLMREAFKLPFSSQEISPLNLTPRYLDSKSIGKNTELLPLLDEAFNRCRKDYDLVIIDGSSEPYVGFNLGLDNFSLAQRWKAAVIYISRAESDFELDQALFHSTVWQNKNSEFIGSVFNNVSRRQWDKVRSLYKTEMENRDVPVLGIVPRHPDLSAPTVAEYNNVLQGEILAAPDRMNRLVEEVVIGSMTIESALSYLRKAPNKALITGGDRSDMALTALETNTSALILTGGLYPDVRVLSKAEEKGVPVILVHQDTFSTVESLHSVYRSIHPSNKQAIATVKENIGKYMDWEHILSRVYNK